MARNGYWQGVDIGDEWILARSGLERAARAQVSSLKGGFIQ
jgi:hypothetical protein